MDIIVFPSIVPIRLIAFTVDIEHPYSIYLSYVNI